MRKAWNLLVLGSLLAVVSASTGCSKKNETAADAPAASINGASGASSAAQTNPAAPAKPAPDPFHPLVEIQTNLGDFTVELDAKEAPMTVNNFLGYVERRHYDQTIFHQVLKDQAIIGGGYSINGPAIREKTPRTPVYNEAQKCRLKNKEGTIAMVRKPSVKDSATCQFFINVADSPHLDYRGQDAEEYGYCPFGKVTSGMDVVRKIAEVEVTDKKDVPTIGPNEKPEKDQFERMPVQDVVIRSIRQIR